MLGLIDFSQRVGFAERWRQVVKEMARRLFVVEDSFFIKGRGLVLAPGIILQGEERISIGDPIVFRRPDGSCLEWVVGGIEMINCTPPRPRHDVLILLKDLYKSDVPVGSEVWSVDAPPHSVTDPARRQ